MPFKRSSQKMKEKNCVKHSLHSSPPFQFSSPPHFSLIFSFKVTHLNRNLDKHPSEGVAVSLNSTTLNSLLTSSVSFLLERPPSHKHPRKEKKKATSYLVLFSNIEGSHLRFQSEIQRKKREREREREREKERERKKKREKERKRTCFR